MTIAIGGIGSRIQVVASNTFPVGFTLTQFADDIDSYDLPSMEIAGKAMGANGDLLVYPKATPIDVSVGLIPGSDDDKNMAILANANRVARGKLGANDIITMTIIYPDNSFITLIDGAITHFMPGNSMSSAQRKKSRVYQLTFQDLSGTST